MTRDEAIKVIRKMLAYTDLSVRENLTADMVDACRLAIEALEQEPREITLEDVKGYCKPRFLTIITNDLYHELTHSKIKALEQEPRWIPVSERLPKEFETVILSTDKDEVFIGDYLGKMNDGSDCFDDNDGMDWEGDVVAWMPLPQAYREVEE